MAATKRALPEATKTKIRASLLAGMGIRETARKHGVSPPTVLVIKKELTNTELTLVEQGTAYQSGLGEIRAEHPNIAKAISDAVDERTRDLEFFRKGSLLIAQTAIKKVQKESTDMHVYEMKAAVETLGKAKETIFGKQPDTAIQVNQNNAAPPRTVINFIDPDD